MSSIKNNRKISNLMEKLPSELENYILFLSSGSLSLEIYNKKKSINNEIIYYTHNENNIYLNLIDNYEKTPELDMNFDDYYFAHRIPKLEPGY